MDEQFKFHQDKINTVINAVRKVGTGNFYNYIILIYNYIDSHLIISFLRFPFTLLLISLATFWK
jgi:hypothetical protein